MKIGIVGCGLNSDYHINFARSYPGAEIVGIVDRDDAKIKQCKDRFGIEQGFCTINDLVAKTKPDVIHIVTPPWTHVALASEAIEAGCNILIEKPMAFNAEDGKKLYSLAEDKGVMLCAMHNHFFDPCMMKARELIASGQVGKIINVESYYGINTQIDAFRRYPAPNVLPWLYDLPGGVFHDFMPHPLYVMLPFLGAVKDVLVMEKSMGELPQRLSDELRILVKGQEAFGVLTFSFAAKPHLHFVKVYGTKMMVHVNFDTMTTITHPLSSLPKAAQKATYNLSESLQLVTNTIANVWNFGTRKLRPYQGMKDLIHHFYTAIESHADVPVSRQEALNVLDVMDRIWPQIKKTKLNFDPIYPQITNGKAKSELSVLVTGASGFLGTRVVEMLCSQGYSVRALVRKLSNIEKLKQLPVEIMFGDVGSLSSLQPVFKDVDIVVHAAADTAGRAEESETGTIQGTRNILDLCAEHKIKKLVYISSCSVYGVADYAENASVSEASSLERLPRERGFYSYAKLKAEELVIAAMHKSEVPIVCLRPGTIFGPGGEIFTPMMGFALGQKMFAVIGKGDFVLPLVYIDNLCDAIITTIASPKGDGEIFNVVDLALLTKRDYIDRLIKKLYPDALVFYIPFKLLYEVVRLQEWLTAALGRNPFLTRYRLISSQKKIVYDSSKIARIYGWSAPFSIDQALLSVLDWKKGR